ncbi:MAG TPA: primosomal protein N', partial [Candidatus Latescibacteria bacterium]|nr:primosomal protein N' [Candidatus Latescibacterota bacterium]
SRRFSAVLLHGVTGSGKTRVYLDAIEHTLDAGRGAIVLVPEISLTPQTVRRFRSRFQENVAVLHSQLTAGERLDAWRALHEGRKKVAVGPRSAVFAPVRDVGLIVVDEEHDGSYKQEDSDPRYHARDVAVMRARMSDSVVLLGSATPSLESLQNVRRGKYTYVRLPGRVDDKPLPEVQIVDMRKERTDGNWGGLPVAPFRRCQNYREQEPGSHPSEQARLLNGAAMFQVRFNRRMPELPGVDDVSPSGRRPEMSLLRRCSARPEDVSGMQRDSVTILGNRYAESGGRNLQSLPECDSASHGSGHNPREKRAPQITGKIPKKRGFNPPRNPNGREGARLPERYPCGSDLCRHWAGTA